MVSFIIYDISFLVLFCAFVVWFLVGHRKNLEREGIMFLYRTQVGVRVMDYMSKRFRKVFFGLRYVIIFLGWILMIGILWMLISSIGTYIYTPEITKIISAPPVMPLLPYFPQLFGVESLLPPFYFTTFLLAILIVAVFHEFAHGVYMKLFGVKIKSTGFVFLGPILGAFVEQDDEQLKKKKPIEQMTILSAGVFANILVAIIFFLLLMGFFSLAYTQNGFVFNVYSSDVGSATGLVEDLNSSGNLLLVENYLNSSFYVRVDNKTGVMNNLGIIVGFDDVKIRNGEEVSLFLQNKNPGDVVEASIFVDGELKKYEWVLGGGAGVESGRLGVGFLGGAEKSSIKSLISKVYQIKNPSIDYEPRFEAADFIFNLLWWIMMINFFVALFNMLPVGILDGGRFFYLSIFLISNSENVAKKFSKTIAWGILFIFILLMVVWFMAL